MDIIDIVLDIPTKLADLAATLQEWIFDGITLFGYNVSFWAILGGLLIGALIVLSIVRG